MSATETKNPTREVFNQPPNERVATSVELGQFGVGRMAQVADGTGSSLVYSDYYDLKAEKRTAHPLTDYQFGSIRDRTSP